MRTTPAPALIAVLLAAACSEQPPAAPAAAVTPQAAEATSAESPAGQGAGAEYAARCDAGLAEARELLTALESTPAAPSVATVLDPFNELTRRIDNGAYGADLYFNVHPDPAVREAARACSQAYSSLDTDLYLSRPVYEAISAVDLSGEDAATRYFVGKQLLAFRMNGVDLDEASRARVRQLNDDLSALGNEFAANIAGDVRAITLASAEELAGLPADYVAAHAPAGDGGIRITTNYPDYIPFMRYAESDEHRRALYAEFLNRAWPANEPVLDAMLEKRHELARLTGFRHWADRATADKMTGSAEAARAFIAEGSAAAEPRALEDYAELLARLRQVDPAATRVEPWQGSWLANRIRQEKYALDGAELRAYFEFIKVRDGIFALVSDLFGLEIRPREAEVWHEDVSAWEMWDGDRPLGYFYLDMHPREGKFKHAAMFQIRKGIAGRHLPEAALVTNLPGGGGEKGYLEKEQVETFLHEFGHLVHWLAMNHQRWGRNTTPEWDFIEAPSMMLQEWVYDTETLQRFATNDAGEPIPAELVAKMRAARSFGEGLTVHTQMYYAAVSLNFYNADPATFELEPRFVELTGRYSLYPHLDGTHMYASFGHLDGYSAFYYTYMWSLVIATDMFSRFEAEGLRNRETARDYLEKVLAPGGSRPAAESVADFLGRPYDFEAFKARLEGT